MHLVKGIQQKNGLIDRRYTLLKKIGGGGFSEVWLAEDIKTQKKIQVALKIYSGAEGLNEDGKNMFQSEFVKQFNLKHRNILRIINYDKELYVSYPDKKEEIYDYPYLVLEFCSHGAANNLVGKLSEEEVWVFVQDVAYGLAFLHDDKKIVHQDIKPANILIDDNGNYVITDFGISEELHETIRQSVNLNKKKLNQNYGAGTPEYMGPERWPRPGYIPPTPPIFASDIWSFGATLFQMLEGRLPYQGFNKVGGELQRDVKVLPEMSSRYSNELKKLVQMCLAEEPWKRPSAREIADSALMRKAPILPPDKEKRKRKQYIAFGGGVCAMILAGVIIFSGDDIGGGKEKNLVDSLFLARVTDATTMVKKDSVKSVKERYENYAEDYVKELARAADLYISTDTLPVSHDSIRMKGKDIWKDAQKIIDEEYQYFAKQERECRDMDAPFAASKYKERCRVIQEYVSDTLKYLNNYH